MPRLTALGSILLLACLTACGGGSKDAASEGSGVAVCGLTSAGGGELVLLAAEPNNYAFSSTLTISEVLVAPQTELTFDWSGVTVDFVGHDVDPVKDIDMLALIVWKLSSEELAVRLNADDLSQSDFEAIAMVYNEDATTSGRLFDFTEFGVEIDRDLLLAYLDPDTFDPDEHAYTAVATTGTTPGKDTRMVKAFRLDPASTNTSVALDSDSAALDYTVDLTSLAPVEVPAGEPEITIDWSRIAVNAMGAEFDPTSITEVMVGKFSESIEDIEARFLDISFLADELYRGEVLSGSSFSLADTASEAGAGFQGIDDTGTWLVALRCGTCTNPAPWFMTALRTCDAAAAAAP